jgi:hypothetical protein
MIEKNIVTNRGSETSPPSHIRLSRTLLLLAAGAAATLETHAAIAEPQALPASDPSAAQQSDAAPGSNYNGEEFTRPEGKFETRFEGTTSGSTTRTNREALLLRLDGAINLAAARLVAPTAQDSLGSGKWQIMPGFGIRYSFLEYGSDTYFVPKIRYAISFSGDPSRRNISEPQIAPTLNIGLPSRWFVTLFPSYDIRINNGDPVSGQTGRLFLPFDAAIGRKVTDDAVMSLEVSVPIIKDYPVYNFKTELRLSLRF